MRLTGKRVQLTLHLRIIKPFAPALITLAGPLCKHSITWNRPVRRCGSSRMQASTSTPAPVRAADHVVLRSADPVASVEWWAKTLGLEPLRVRFSLQCEQRVWIGEVQCHPSIAPCRTKPQRL